MCFSFVSFGGFLCAVQCLFALLSFLGIATTQSRSFPFRKVVGCAGPCTLSSDEVRLPNKESESNGVSTVEKLNDGKKVELSAISRVNFAMKTVINSVEMGEKAYNTFQL